MQTSCKENKTVLVHYFSLVTLASGCARFMQLQKSCLNKSDRGPHIFMQAFVHCLTQKKTTH